MAAQNARDKKKTEAETLKSENDQLRSLVEQLRKEQKQQQVNSFEWFLTQFQIYL